MEGGIFIINLIVAFDENYLIGDGSNLPWNLPKDLKKFKEITSGNIVIMGRKTYESIGRPLPNRINMVITRNKDYKCDEGVFVFNNIEDAIRKAKVFHKEIFFIGGRTIYEKVLDEVDTMYISHVKGSYKGDTYFPKFDLSLWDKRETQEFEKFVFIKYEKK